MNKSRNLRSCNSSRSGFTLLEMSIVLLVLALLSGGILTLMTQNARISKKQSVDTKMDAIEEALLDFVKQNGRIPCPADGTQLNSVANFGIEAATPGTCTGGAPAANFTDGASIVGGVVPTKTLGLPDEYQFDPWGGRFMYYADMRATSTAAFTSIYPITSSFYIAGFTVNDLAGNAKAAKAVVVIISGGPDGHGMFQLNGTRKSVGVMAGAAELENCKCTAAIPTVANTFDNVVIQGESTNAVGGLSVFDDIVRYYTRSMLPTSADLITETR